MEDQMAADHPLLMHSRLSSDLRRFWPRAEAWRAVPDRVMHYPRTASQGSILIKKQFAIEGKNDNTK
jgi:hypothetical protein